MQSYYVTYFRLAREHLVAMSSLQSMSSVLSGSIIYKLLEKHKPDGMILSAETAILTSFIPGFIPCLENVFGDTHQTAAFVDAVHTVCGLLCATGSFAWFGMDKRWSNHQNESEENNHEKSKDLLTHPG